jgi:hypothetical protein
MKMLTPILPAPYVVTELMSPQRLKLGCERAMMKPNGHMLNVKGESWLPTMMIFW